MEPQSTLGWTPRKILCKILTHDLLVLTVNLHITVCLILIYWLNVRLIEHVSVALYIVIMISMMTLSHGRILSYICSNSDRLYYWSGRAWVMRVCFLSTIMFVDASSTDIVSDRPVTYDMITCIAILSVTIGAQGALLNVSAEMVLNSLMMMTPLCISAWYTKANMTLYMTYQVGLIFGYMCFSFCFGYMDMLKVVQTNETVMISTLSMRNKQLVAEKERLQWDHVLSHHDNMLCMHNHTLGDMKDIDEVSRLISDAHSFDHNSRNPSPESIKSLKSLESSEMDTISVAARRDITRAPAPPKMSRPSITKCCSEPMSTKPVTHIIPRLIRRPIPGVEKDPREYS